jgi:3-dehydroquinate synthase
LKFAKPQLKYTKQLPAVKALQPERSIVIFDQILLQNSDFIDWMRNFPFQLPVASGENLKDLGRFSTEITKIIELTQKIEKRPLRVICIGGGSVGDFAGFAASVLKRGVDLIQIPSTWLAAIDSAHGGKNALNVSGIKNQIGTFHHPKQVWLVEAILSQQPIARIEDAYGEALKVSLLEGGTLWKAFASVRNWDSNAIWKILPRLIEAKYKIVAKDPMETKGIRHLLNFGHTVGHVFEAELGISHGRAVLYGLGFALEWSRAKKLLKNFSAEIPEHKSYLQTLRDPARYLGQDKKRVSESKLRFIFLKKPGKPIIQSVTIPEILKEIERQKA